jgi:GTPase SAR1 family protein
MSKKRIECTLRIVTVGDAQVGKSNLVSRFSVRKQQFNTIKQTSLSQIIFYQHYLIDKRVHPSLPSNHW